MVNALKLSDEKQHPTRYRLELQYETLTVREYRVQGGDIRFIGRAPENHMVIDDPGISRKHCFIIQTGGELFTPSRSLLLRKTAAEPYLPFMTD